MRNNVCSVLILPAWVQKHFPGHARGIWYVIIASQLLAALSILVLPAKGVIFLWCALSFLLISFYSPIVPYFAVLVMLYTPFVLFRVGQADIHFCDLFVYIALILWCIRGLVEKKLSFQQTVIDQPIYMLLAWVTLSLVWTPSIGRGIHQYLRTMQGFMVFFLTVNMIRNKRDFRLAMTVWLAAVAVFCVVGIHEWFHLLTQGSFKIGQGGKLFTGKIEFTGNNTLGMLLDYSLLVAIPMYFSFSSKRQKFCWLILIFSMSMGLVASLSRKSWVSFMAGMAFFVAYSKKIILVSFCIVILSLGFVFLMSQAGGGSQVIVAKFMTLFKGAKVEIPNRLQTWGMTWGLIKENPVLGSGVGSYYILADQLDLPLMVTHNFYIYLLQEFGFVGLLLFLFLVVKLAFHFIEFLKKCGDENLRLIARGFIAAFVAALVHGGFRTFGLYEPVNWLFLGFAVSFFNLYSKKDA